MTRVVQFVKACVEFVASSARVVADRWRRRRAERLPEAEHMTRVERLRCLEWRAKADPSIKPPRRIA